MNAPLDTRPLPQAETAGFDRLLRFVVVIALIAACLRILAPFLGALIWGVIIAVTLWPSFIWLEARLGRRTWLATILTALVLVVGALPLLTPGDGFSLGAAWWLLHGVLYAVSLSSLLLGLSSAHAEAEEYVWIMGQPAGIGPWLTGKVAGLVLLTGGSTALICAPVMALDGGTRALAVVTVGAVGISAVCALVGFALGFWVRDGVRGLIAAVAGWFVMLFGVDLLLLALAGAPWVQANPDVWIA